MAFDAGYIILPIVLIFIVATLYKKKTGENLSELWKNRAEKIDRTPKVPEFQRVYITKGIKT